jgi:hypothetical protein
MVMTRIRNSFFTNKTIHMKRAMRFTILIICLAGCKNPGSDKGPVPNDTTTKLTVYRHLPPGKIYIRRNIYSLKPTSPDLIAYKKGVEIMKARPATDPTSWTYQAAIHGTYDMTANTSWNSCQHGSFFFLSWHRMYLYFFERIVRQASGNADFALPYWNYSDDPAQSVLPPAFRIPSDNSNTLFNFRDAKINGGQPLQPSAVEYQNEMMEPLFTSSNIPAPGFGGITVSGPFQLHWPHGVIEHQPHDAVHDDIGGDMLYPMTSAHDPIFYLHHANIDRLWQHWTAQGGTDPVSDVTWMNTPFTFFDESGAQVTMTGKEVIDIESQLGYRYDDEPSIGGKLIKPEKPFPWLPIDTSFEKIDYFTSLEKATSGRRTDIKMQFENGKNLRELMNKTFDLIADTSNKSAERVMINFEDITYQKRPTGIFEVYINLPSNTRPDYKNIYYAGNITLFGLMSHHGAQDQMKMETGGSLVLNITRTIRQLKNNRVNLGNLTISIIHRGSSPQSDDLITGEIKIKGITVYGLQKG